jgi:Ca-activated chloride channel homolog
MTYCRLSRWSAFLMCIDAALLCHAGGRSANPQQPTYRSGIEVVRLDVLVTRSGRPVTGLAAADFEVRDDGAPQRVDLAISAGAVDVLLVLDTSSSVAGPPLRALVAAAEALLDDLKPDDRVALLTFSERVVMGSGLARNLSPVRQRLSELEAGGATSLRDALFAALTLPLSDSRRTLVVLFSDGADNTSWLSAEAVLEATKRSETVVYPVASGAAASRAGALKEHRQFLQRLAEETGGNLLQADSASGLRTAFRGILAEFRSRYLLSYSPVGAGRARGWHEIEVKLKGKAGKVKARPGYWDGGPRPKVP